jgi:hypothetical protein
MDERKAIEQEPLELMGRTFLLTPEADLTFEQYGYVQRAAHDAGMGEEMQAILNPKIDAIRAGDEVAEHVWREISERILMRAFTGRAHLDILSGILVERGQEWTRAQADANREFFAKVKGPDIKKLHGILIQCVVGFFLSGLVSLRTSPSSSERRLGAVAAMAGVSLRPKPPSGGENGSETTEK